MSHKAECSFSKPVRFVFLDMSEESRNTEQKLLTMRNQQLFNKLQELFGVTALESEMHEVILAVLKETEVFEVVYKIPFDSKGLGYFFDKEAAHTFIKQEIESFGSKWELMQTDLPHYSSDKGEELFVTKIEVK